jgi:hypothetical protein
MTAIYSFISGATFGVSIFREDYVITILVAVPLTVLTVMMVWDSGR